MTVSKMRALGVVLLAVTLGGCSPYFSGAGHTAAAGALDEFTSPDSTKRLATLTAIVTAAARDEALGATTGAEAQKIISDAIVQFERAAPVLQARLREAIRVVIDEALSTKTLQEGDALRERFVGDPLRQDLNSLIDDAAPHLTRALTDSLTAAVASAVVPLQTAIAQETVNVRQGADQEAAKWRPIAMGFAAGTLALLGCLVFAGVVIRGHRRTIETLAKRL